MLDATKRALAAIATNRFAIGQILVRSRNGGGFLLCHRQDERTEGLQVLSCRGDAREIARIDDRGNYRPLKTAPNLRRGWRLEVADLSELQGALDHFYPGRLAMLAAWNKNELKTTPLRETLNRQSGRYRVAAKISDEQVDDVVGNFCRSDGGCLRTILWKRD